MLIYHNQNTVKQSRSIKCDLDCHQWCKPNIFWTYQYLFWTPCYTAGISIPALLIGVPVWVGRKIHGRYQVHILPHHWPAVLTLPPEFWSSPAEPGHHEWRGRLHSGHSSTGGAGGLHRGQHLALTLPNTVLTFHLVIIFPLPSLTWPFFRYQFCWPTCMEWCPSHSAGTVLYSTC